MITLIQMDTSSLSFYIDEKLSKHLFFTGNSSQFFLILLFINAKINNNKTKNYSKCINKLKIFCVKLALFIIKSIVNVH